MFLYSNIKYTSHGLILRITGNLNNTLKDKDLMNAWSESGK